MPEPRPAKPPGLLAQARLIAVTDLRIEWASREILYTMSFLAVLVVLIFSFAFLSTGLEVSDAERVTAAQALKLGALRIEFGPGVVAGIIWVAVLFSGTVGLARTFDREREGEAIRSLLLSPVPRSAIYLGKLAATVFIMLIVEIIVVPLCGLFFKAPVFAHAAHLGLMLVLGSIGFAAVGVIFSAALLRARSRDVLLSTLLYPVVVPVLLAGARGTSTLLDPLAPDLGPAVFWTQFLAVMDLVFILIGVWSFEPVATGE